MSNPPYIPTTAARRGSLVHEPTLALDGGSDGLEAVRAILAEAAAHDLLAPSGLLILELSRSRLAAATLAASRLGWLPMSSHAISHSDDGYGALVEVRLKRVASVYSSYTRCRHRSTMNVAQVKVNRSLCARKQQC